MNDTELKISDNAPCAPAVTAIKISVSMKSGRTWTGTVTRETAEGTSHMNRAKCIIQRSLEPNVCDSCIPLSVFLDMFYMAKVSAGCSTIEPTPDPASPKEACLKQELLAEARAWIAAVESVGALMKDAPQEDAGPKDDESDKDDGADTPDPDLQD